MPKAILLTQYCAPIGSAPPVPLPAATAAPAAAPAAPLLVHYRSAEQPTQHALLQYYEQVDPPVAIADCTDVHGDAARYLCVETEDSGASAEPGRVLMIVAFCVPEQRAAEVEQWYRQEHGPLLLRAPGWLRMRRYRPISSSGGPRWTHLALHELRSLAVLDSHERALARSTPWRALLAREPWFEQAGRWVYERVGGDV
jgi:hypothetical protein